MKWSTAHFVVEVDTRRVVSNALATPNGDQVKERKTKENRRQPWQMSKQDKFQS